RDASDAVDRSINSRPAEVQLRRFDGCRRRVDLRLRSTESLHRVIELFLADGAFCGERRVACNIELVLLERRLFSPELADALVERRLVLAVVDLEKQIACFERAAVGVGLSKKVTLHARAHLRVD